MSSPKTYTSLSGKIIKETDAAMLFRFQGTSYWFPLSQICEIHRDIDGDDITDEDGQPLSSYYDQIKVADWLLNKKGISL